MSKRIVRHVGYLQGLTFSGFYNRKPFSCRQFIYTRIKSLTKKKRVCNFAAIFSIHLIYSCFYSRITHTPANTQANSANKDEQFRFHLLLYNTEAGGNFQVGAVRLNSKCSSFPTPRGQTGR
jgi:hypothetical protein